MVNAALLTYLLTKAMIIGEQHPSITIDQHDIEYVENFPYLYLGTETEIQLPLKRFPDSGVSSLIWTGWCGGAYPAIKTSLQYPWVKNWLMAIFPLVVKLNLIKCHQRFGCLPWDKRPTLA